MHGISSIYISAFMPLKNTSAFPWNLIEIVSCVKAWKRGVGAENATLNEFKKKQIAAYWKVDIFSYRPMQMAKTSDQFENPVLVIVGN